MDDSIVRRMMHRFRGFDKAYGSYNPDLAKADIRVGKIEIKSTAFTRRASVTLELWRAHLEGKQPLGIIPIRDNDTCVWSCIDIDDYSIDVLEILNKIKDFKLPLISCASKSGGLHNFLFTKDPPIAASLIQLRQREWAAQLGFGSAEVFPKQSKVAVDRGDLGSWLNMPYFGNERWAYRPDGTLMPLEEFLDLADIMEQTKDEIYEDTTGYAKRGKIKEAVSATDFTDGPPCLAHLANIGLAQGSRNNGIIAFGIYAKKKYPTLWPEVLDRWNRDVCIPPLPVTELADIIRRLEKKDYYYPCKEQPIVAHCNSAVCRTRRFGVASDNVDEAPITSGLTILPTEPPLWFMDVNNHRLEFTTDQLLNFNAFQKVCAERVQLYFIPMAQKSWGRVILSLMKEVNRLEVTPEMGLPGQFIELLDDFVNNQFRAQMKDEILLGRPWLDENESKHYFRLRDLNKFLNEANFKVYTAAQITTRLRALGGDKHFFKLKDPTKKDDNYKGVNVWWVPMEFAKPTHPIPLAELLGDPI